MRKTHLLSTALGATLLLAAPAMAQTLQRSQGGPGYEGPPSTSMTPSDSRDVSRLLSMSGQALDRGNFRMANEYLERAETSTLNQRAMSGGRDVGHSDLVDRISGARAALRDRNRAEARRQIVAALDEAGMGDQAMSTGAGVTTMPAQGGGAAAGPRRSTREAGAGGAVEPGAFRRAEPRPGSPAAEPLPRPRTGPPGPVTTGGRGGRDMNLGPAPEIRPIQ